MCEEDDETRCRAVCEEVKIMTPASGPSLSALRDIYPPMRGCDPELHGFWGDFECTSDLSKCPRQEEGGCIDSYEDFTRKTFYYGIGYNCSGDTHDD